MAELSKTIIQLSLYVIFAWKQVQLNEVQFKAWSIRQAQYQNLLLKDNVLTIQNDCFSQPFAFTVSGKLRRFLDKESTGVVELRL